MKLKKIEKKLSMLEQKKIEKPSSTIDKKIEKLEKKKTKLEKWLRVKLPVRILIKGVAVWLVIGGICYICSYVPVVKEIKVAAMGAIAYAAPEPVVKILDVVTLNVGVNNNDFEWLKTTLKGYIDVDIILETDDKEGDIGHYSDENGDIYTIKGEQVSKEEYNRYIEEQNGKLENMVGEVFGTTTAKDISSMSLSELIMKVATNSTPELVSQLLDMTNLTSESKKRAEQDINKALKVITKLNNNQMNELVDIINDIIEEESLEIDQKTIYEIQDLLNDFIDKVSETGIITLSDYNKFEQDLYSKGNYTIELELQILDDNPRKQ